MKALMLAIAVGLAAALYLQWRDWSPAVVQAPVQPAPDAAPAAAGGARAAADLLAPPPPKEDYASVVERPLFLPDRRPPPDEPEDEAEVGPEEESDLAAYDLTAVLITPTSVSALVRQQGQQRSLPALQIGDTFEGWTVKTIEPDRLVLERQGESNELVLRDYENAPPPIPPTRLPEPARRQTAGRPQPPSARAPQHQRAGQQPTPRTPLRRDLRTDRKPVRRPTQLPGGAGSGSPAGT